MKKCYRFGLALTMTFGSLGFSAPAQTLDDFLFMASQDSFIELVGGTTAALSGNIDDGMYQNIPLGFNFEYLGVTYNTVSAGTDGWLSFVAAPSITAIQGRTNALASGPVAMRPLLAPLWDDLDMEIGTFSYSSLVQGPDSIFIAQWLNAQWVFNAVGATISLQVILNQTDRSISFKYRQEAGSVLNPTASIGITAAGTGPGNFISLNNSGPNPTISTTVETNNISTKPATGQLYKFMPPVPVNVNLGVTAFLAPVTGCGTTSTDTVTIRIKNFGLQPQSGIPVSYTINNGTPVTEFFAGTLAPNAEAEYTFFATANLGTPGLYVFKGWTSMPGEQFTLNDTLSNYQVTSIPSITTFPYFENFENGAGGWISSGNANSWALGNPSGSVINSAASGANSWVTNLSGSYNANENSRVVSPCFSFAGLLNPQIEMKIWWDTETCCDGAVLQSSSDGGITWQVVGNFNDPDFWYNSNSISGNPGGQSTGWRGTGLSGSGGWVTAKNYLLGLGGQTSVILRIAFASNASTQNNGFAFDDVKIFDAPPNDVGISRIISPSSGCGLSSSSPITLVLKNYGTLTQTGFGISYKIDSNFPVTEFVSGQLAPNDTLVYTFFTNGDFTTIGFGNYAFQAWTSLTGDTSNLNDSLATTIQTIPGISAMPYFEDFESGSGGWADGGVLSSWQLGTPTGSVINSAGSGNNSWTTNLSGSYNDNERSYVESPCFNISGMSDPQVELKVWWNMESNWDGAALRYSTDAGNSWKTLGVHNDPNGTNWYNGNLMSNAAVRAYFDENQNWWSGRNAVTNNGSGTWVTSTRFNTGLGSSSSVIFRIVFGTDGSVVDDGFAFDDFKLFEGPLGVKNLTKSNEGLLIYPNPAKDKVNIHFGKDFENQKSTVLLFDMQGRNIYSGVASFIQPSEIFEFETAHLPRGVYLVRIQGENKSITRKLILD